MKNIKLIEVLRVIKNDMESYKKTMKGDILKKDLWDHNGFCIYSLVHLKLEERDIFEPFLENELTKLKTPFYTFEGKETKDKHFSFAWKMALFTPRYEWINLMLKTYED